MSFKIHNRPISSYPWFGINLALFGSLVITPDTLLIRLSGLDAWGLTIWRGALIGVSVLAIWLVFFASDIKVELKKILSFPFFLMSLSVGISNIAFNFATAETSITVVLSTLATAPVIAAVLSYLILAERTSKLTWIAVTFCIIGVMIVILSSGKVENSPSGNIFLGALYSIISACGLSLFFVLSRKFFQTPVLLALALGAILPGLIGLIFYPVASLLDGEIVPIFLMGVIIMPMALTFLSIAPRYTQATNVSLFMLLELVLGPFWVWLGVGEQPNLIMIGGALIVLLTLTTYILISSKADPLKANQNL